MTRTRAQRHLLRALQTTTGAELAREIGCSPAALSELVSGHTREPKLSLALRIRDRLGVPVDDWIREDDLRPSEGVDVQDQPVPQPPR